MGLEPRARIDNFTPDPRSRRIKAPIYRHGGKRLLDTFLVLAALPILFFTVGLIALAMLIVERANPFYTQLRVGKGGKAFRIWKLRTMVPNADEMLESHLAADPAARQEWDRTQKLTHDPRITLIGGLLRPTSIDELPQLWNVLTGDMSLVGPRPMMLDQQKMYPSNAYYQLRPGLTGPWQVSARHRSAFADRARYDDEYEANLTLSGDIALLFKTVRVVLRGTGC